MLFGVDTKVGVEGHPLLTLTSAVLQSCSSKWFFGHLAAYERTGLYLPTTLLLLPIKPVAPSLCSPLIPWRAAPGGAYTRALSLVYAVQVHWCMKWLVLAWTAINGHPSSSRFRFVWRLSDFCSSMAYSPVWDVANCLQMSPVVTCVFFPACERMWFPACPHPSSSDFPIPFVVSENSA